jgi:hypothetical protein
MFTTVYVLLCTLYNSNVKYVPKCIFLTLTNVSYACVNVTGVVWLTMVCDGLRTGI